MLGYLFALLSALATSAGSVEEKAALKREHSIDFALFLGIAAFILYLPFAWLFADFNITPRQIALIYISSLFGALGFWLGAKSIKRMDVSVAVPLFNINLIFVAVLAYFILGESLTPFQTGGIFLIIAGAYLLEINHGKLDIFYPFKEFYRERAFHFLLSSMAVYSFAAVVDRVILQEVGVATYLFFVYGFLSFNLFLIFWFIHKEPLAKTYLDAVQNIPHILSGATLKLIGSFFLASAFSMMFVGIALAIKRLSALFSVIVGGRLFHEEHIKWRFGAAVIMVAGAILMVLQ